MTWPQVILTALIALLLVACWYRYSIQKGRLRRLAELYLWLGAILPLGALARVHEAGGLAAFVPAGVVHLVLIGIALLGVSAPAGGTGTMPRLGGALLILGSTVVWLGAVTWPGMALEKVASHPADHLFTSGAFLVGALITLAGFTLLATMLRDAGERVYSQLGSVAFLLGVVTWTLHLAFRATVMVSAAGELTASRHGAGVVPSLAPVVRVDVCDLYGARLSRGRSLRRWHAENRIGAQRLGPNVCDLRPRRSRRVSGPRRGL